MFVWNTGPMEGEPAPITTLEQVADAAAKAQSVAIKVVDNKQYWPDPFPPGPFAGTMLVELDRSEAAQILRRLRGLTPGKQKRCHSPRYSLTMTGPDLAECEISFCFDCNNGRTRVEDSPGWITFDAMSHAASELLRHIKKFDPERREEPEWWVD